MPKHRPRRNRTRNAAALSLIEILCGVTGGVGDDTCRPIRFITPIRYLNRLINVGKWRVINHPTHQGANIGYSLFTSCLCLDGRARRVVLINQSNFARKKLDISIALGHHKNLILSLAHHRFPTLWVNLNEIICHAHP